MGPKLANLLSFSETLVLGCRNSILYVLNSETLSATNVAYSLTTYLYYDYRRVFKIYLLFVLANISIDYY